MVQCDECDFEAKSSQGLASHRWARHSDRGEAGSNVEALEITIAELHRLGRFEEVDAARVQSLRSMAAALDQNPFNSQMWREYRESLNEVLRSDDDADDGLAAALAQIRGSSEMGDSS